MFTETLFTMAKTWKQPQCPLMDERILKMGNIYIYIKSAFKMKEILPFMKILEGIMLMLSEISQRKREIPYDLTYM